MRFTTRNLRENVQRPAPARIILNDVDGNRYDIRDVDALSRGPARSCCSGTCERGSSNRRNADHAGHTDRTRRNADYAVHGSSSHGRDTAFLRAVHWPERGGSDNQIPPNFGPFRPSEPVASRKALAGKEHAFAA